MVSWRYPDTTKRVRVAFVCPTGSDPALSVVGTFCPITPDVMITQCSAAYFLAWVRRNFTFLSKQILENVGALILRTSLASLRYLLELFQDLFYFLFLVHC